jgi:hypothetical protein
MLGGARRTEAGREEGELQLHDGGGGPGDDLFDPDSLTYIVSDCFSVRFLFVFVLCSSPRRLDWIGFWMDEQLTVPWRARLVVFVRSNFVTSSAVAM